jgi:hypothetical protein
VVPIDIDVVAWFERQGPKPHVSMNAVLRAHVLRAGKKKILLRSRCDRRCHTAPACSPSVPTKERAMASATFENGQALRTVRAAIRAERLRAGEGARSAEPQRAQTGGATRRSAESTRAPAIWRGVGASLAIASGYVALVTAIRWLLLLA